MGTGLGMLYYNFIGNQGEARDFLVLAHEIVAVLFIAGPILAFALGVKKVWAENYRILTKWGWSDIEWLMKKPLTTVFKKIKLPKDDKFNPGQKVWATIAVSGSFVLAVSGGIMWTTGSPIAALIIHTVVAVAMLTALLGHMYMALLNPETRHGVGSIIDGEVSVEWAKEHHPLWVEKMARERVLTRIRNNRDKLWGATTSSVQISTAKGRKEIVGMADTAARIPLFTPSMISENEMNKAQSIKIFT